MEGKGENWWKTISLQSHLLNIFLIHFSQHEKISNARFLPLLLFIPCFFLIFSIFLLHEWKTKENFPSDRVHCNIVQVSMKKKKKKEGAKINIIQIFISKRYFNDSTSLLFIDISDTYEEVEECFYILWHHHTDDKVELKIPFYSTQLASVTELNIKKVIAMTISRKHNGTMRSGP